MRVTRARPDRPWSQKYSPSNQTQSHTRQNWVHGRKQTLLGEDREGLCRAWRFATWRASLRKAAWYVMTSGSAFFWLAKTGEICWKQSNPNMLSSKPGTLPSFLILVGVFLGFWVATPHIPRHATIPRKIMHGWTLCNIRLPTCEPREIRLTSSRNPPSSSNHLLHGWSSTQQLVSYDKNQLMVAYPQDSPSDNPFLIRNSGERLKQQHESPCPLLEYLFYRWWLPDPFAKYLSKWFVFPNSGWTFEKPLTPPSSYRFSNFKRKTNIPSSATFSTIPIHSYKVGPVTSYKWVITPLGRVE